MATAAQFSSPDPQMMVPPSPSMQAGGAPQPKAPEPSPSTPQVETAQARKQRMGLTSQMETDVLAIIKTHEDMWAEERRTRIKKALRGIEYDNGNQYISWDQASGTYVNPFADVLAGSPFGANGSSEGTSSLYTSTNNLVQWARKVFVSTLTSSIPRVEWWPGDAESDLDNRAAKARSQAFRKIGRDNKEEDLLELALEHLFLTGSYFRFCRWSMDEKLTGTRMEPDVQWADKQVTPDGYICPKCGESTPADPTTGAAPMCASCGYQLSSANFHPGITVNAPTIVGQKAVPNGQVRFDIFNLLNVNCMPNVDTATGNPIAKTPMLDLQVEITHGAFRTLYPDSWKEVGQSTSGDTASQIDSQEARDARYRITSPGMSMSSRMAGKMTTYRRVWLQPEAINILPNQESAQALTPVIGKGVCVVILNNKVIDIRPAELAKEWTWCGAKKGAGTYPPAPIEPGLDIQDRFNDRINGTDQYQDRMGNPPILFDETMFGKDAITSRSLPPGSLLGLPVNRDVARSLKDGLFQPDFHTDPHAYEWIQEAMQLFQLLVGIVPQTYGGSDPNIQTKGGQDQAKTTAIGILMLNLKQVRRENADAANIAVACLAENAVEDQRSVTRDEDAPDFQNEIIALSDLRGSAVAYPEASENYPISFEQQQALYKELVIAAPNNPVIGEVLDSYPAQRMAMKYLGPPDLELPQKPARDKCLRDIGMLLKGQAIPTGTIDGVTGLPVFKPSVSPDPETDNFEEVSIPLVTDYILKNYALSQTNQPVFQNLYAYLKMCKAFEAQKQAMEQPAVPEGGPGGGAPKPQPPGQ